MKLTPERIVELWDTQVRSYGRQACEPAHMRFARAIEAELEKQATGWRPIAEAPKDGTLILLGHPGALEDDDSRCAVSLPGRWYEGDEDGPDCMGSDGGFVDVDFQFFSFPRSFGAEKYRSEGFQPTHWQTLPDPPSPSGATEGGD